MTVYVYSTLSSNNEYCSWLNTGSGANIKEHGVTIYGGANVANKHFVTPKGVVTEITEDDLDFLKTVPAFNEHVRQGYIVFETIKADPDKVASNMTAKDLSAPMTPESAEKAGAHPA